MAKTKVVNETGSALVLKEGTAGVYRMLHNLPNGEEYSIKVDPHATYREYFCAVPLNDDKYVVLSSDDCMEYKEVHIKLKDDKTTYTWDAYKRGSNELVEDAGNKEKQQQAQEGPGTSGEDPGFVGKFLNKIKSLFS